MLEIHTKNLIKLVPLANKGNEFANHECGKKSRNEAIVNYTQKYAVNQDYNSNKNILYGQSISPKFICKFIYLQTQPKLCTRLHAGEILKIRWLLIKSRIKLLK